MKIITVLKFTVCLTIASFSLASDADISNGQVLPELACRYEMHIVPQDKSQTEIHKTWYFWRTANSVQTQDADGGHGEIWQRSTTGNIQYRKLYHNDKTAVEYMPADNASNNISFDWIKLSSMLSQQELDSLKYVKKSEIMGKRSELRTGKIDGQSLEVQWLVDEKLPASIIRKDGVRTVELRLLDIAPLLTTQYKPVSVADIGNYRQIDATDFGDMENDPFVKKLMAVEGQHTH
ncbi:hypothetical protein [Crenothrix polyspora]|uniref:Secreted protein n=1 Tax=Crenothrix polyspora TaxID=360316 RepID=A0A1R4GZT3_9GAMM|nr:hypothetical protein [Crenothrix polyspora]SJM89513.1 conserved exported hypothetical protein [Crenothrix polyspora]